VCVNKWDEVFDNQIEPVSQVCKEAIVMQIRITKKNKKICVVDGSMYEKHIQTLHRAWHEYPKIYRPS